MSRKATIYRTYRTAAMDQYTFDPYKTVSLIMDKGDIVGMMFIGTTPALVEVRDALYCELDDVDQITALIEGTLYDALDALGEYLIARRKLREAGMAIMDMRRQQAPTTLGEMLHKIEK